MPRLAGLLETALYVDDKPASVAFFRDVMGLGTLFEDDRLTAFDAGRGSTLLVFRRGASRDDTVLPAGVIPGHDGHGPCHVAFAVPAEDYPAWCTRLRTAGVRERGEMRWPRGARSFYFEDPEGHVLEIATPGLWPTLDQDNRS